MCSEHNIQKVLAMQDTAQCLVTYPHDHLVEGELGLAATAQLHERVSYRISLALEEIKILNSEVWFLLNVYSFCTIVKLKILQVEPL